MAEFIEKHWREVKSRTTLVGADFPKGVKDFKFSIATGYGFIPIQTYFKCDLSIYSDALGTVLPVTNDNIAYADNVCGNLWNNIYFNAAGTPISQNINNFPQCDILKNRLRKSLPYNKSIGEVQGLAGHHYDRLKQLVDVYTLTNNTTVPNVDQLNSENAIKNKRNIDNNIKSFIWQPSIGIMDVAIPLGAGEYEFQLNPSQDFATAGIDTSSYFDNAATVGKIVVVDIKLYVCMCRVDIGNEPQILHLKEMDVKNANISVTAGTTSINEEFTVPSSTTDITIFMQDILAGQNSSCPPSRFHSIYSGGDNSATALDLRNYQIEYAGLTKPVIRYESKYDSSLNTNQLQQRFIQSMIEYGSFFEPSGTETFEEYMERGPIFHESFLKSADNLSTRCHIIANYGTGFVTAARLFVVAHYDTTVKLTRQGGLLTNVLVQAI